MGSATLSSVALVDMGVTGVTGGAGGMKGYLGGTEGIASCLDGLGIWGVDVGGTITKGPGEDDCSSSLCSILRSL